MPRIELINVPLYNPNDPYHWQFDNLPLQNLMRRQNLINLALDDLITQTRDAIGTQGSFANRLNQSIAPDGSLKKTAVNDTMHDMGDHTDDEWGDSEAYDLWVASRNAPFVRMEKADSDKLANIASGATNFSLQVQRDEDGEDVVSFTSGYLKFLPSSSVTWEIEAPNKLKAHLGFPVASAHRHFYDQIPVDYNSSSPDLKKFKVNSTSTVYVEGSLRVFVNGMRLSASEAIYVPGELVNDPWSLLTYTPNHEEGTFLLSASLSEEDVIRIDYDIQYVS